MRKATRSTVCDSSNACASTPLGAPSRCDGVANSGARPAIDLADCACLPSTAQSCAMTHVDASISGTIKTHCFMTPISPPGER